MEKKQFILKTIIDEVIEEINDYAADDPEAMNALLSMWFSKSAMMLEWVATGILPDEADDDPFIREFLTGVSGQPERAAIGA
jgi:hypothetical protein